jgi:hypothetical protein
LSIRNFNISYKIQALGSGADNKITEVFSAYEGLIDTYTMHFLDYLYDVEKMEAKIVGITSTKND